MPKNLHPPRRATRFDRRHLGAVALAAGALVGALACSSSATVDTATSTTASKPAGTTPDTRPAAAGTTPGTARESGTTVVRPGTTTGTAKVATTSTTEATSTTVADDTTTSAAGPTTTIVVAAGDKAFCDLGIGLAEKFKDMDPSKPETVLPIIKEAYAQLVAAAPAEVKAPMTTINDAIQAVTTMDELQAAESADVKAAEAAVDTWAIAHCGKKFGSS